MQDQKEKALVLQQELETIHGQSPTPDTFQAVRLSQQLTSHLDAMIGSQPAPEPVEAPSADIQPTPEEAAGTAGDIEA